MPYSAQITTEILQQLADGNRIERRSMSSVSRDEEGRVRREQQLAAIGPILPQGDVQIVTINDPVAKVHYSLDFTPKDGHPVADDVYEETGRSGLGFLPRKQRKCGTRVQSLGTRDIEGVKAEGTRTTITMQPAASEMSRRSKW